MSKAYVMRHALFMGTDKCHFPLFIGGLQNSVPVRNQSKMPCIQEEPGLQLSNLPNINKIKSIIEEDARFAVRQRAQRTNGFSICPLHSEENS